MRNKKYGTYRYYNNHEYLKIGHVVKYKGKIYEIANISGMYADIVLVDDEIPMADSTGISTIPLSCPNEVPELHGMKKRSKIYTVNNKGAVVEWIMGTATYSSLYIPAYRDTDIQYLYISECGNVTTSMDVKFFRTRDRASRLSDISIRDADRLYIDDRTEKEIEKGNVVYYGAYTTKPYYDKFIGYGKMHDKHPVRLIFDEEGNSDTLNIKVFDSYQNMLDNTRKVIRKEKV